MSARAGAADGRGWAGWFGRAPWRILAVGMLLQRTYRQGYALEDLSRVGPAWLRPIAAAIARWFLFQGA